jgi:hypothetical protein
MTEAEWLACPNPLAMLDFLRSVVSDRKLRLFACAWFSGGSRWAEVADIVAIGEQYADSTASREGIEDARNRALRNSARQCVVVTVADDIARNLSPTFSHEFACTETHLDRCSNHFRDIFGNPFRPVTFTPEWRTSTAVALARQMYESRDFAAMPILADALQDAGCDNDDILAHCRDETKPHVRGCWVVDLVLGKE